MSIFQFKQFAVRQDKCAMKVCTDACLFGAWLANKYAMAEVPPSRILDIGAGTGLLSLMLAQKTNAVINAVEIDKQAALQADENFKNSPWNERLSITHCDIKDLHRPEKYDLIISNPPFYELQLHSPDALKNKAMHSSTLSFKELVASVQPLLQPGGEVALLVPFTRREEMIFLLKGSGLCIREILNIKPTERKPSFRSFIIASSSLGPAKENSMVIRDIRNEYSPEFRQLLRPYYLHL